MRFIKGYKFNTEQESIDTIEICNKHFNIVQDENLITKYYVNYIYDELGFYYIKEHQSLIEILGESNEFEISDIKSFITDEISSENSNIT
jgi:hypothetical protein